MHSILPGSTVSSVSNLDLLDLLYLQYPTWKLSLIDLLTGHCVRKTQIVDYSHEIDGQQINFTT